MALALVLLAGVIGPARSAGAQSADDIDALNRRVLELYGAGKYAEAIRSRGATPNYESSGAAPIIQTMPPLSTTYPSCWWKPTTWPKPSRRCAALAIDEKSFGPEHPNVARDLGNLALLLKDTNRSAEAEP